VNDQAPALRRGRVLRRDREAGILEETATGFRFTYSDDYLRDPKMPAISLTLPKRPGSYLATKLFPCFIALLAEGALAEIQCRTLRLDERDYFGRVLATCGGDVIGSLRVEALS
jgi:serine/threonine-protein kinase HipA